MIKKIVFSLALFLVATWKSLPAQSQGFFPDGKCGIVVASRQSISEVRDFIAANRWGGSPRVFESRNGWLAITTEIIDASSAPTVLARGKQTGLLPDDAYCSTGRMYLRQVEWRDSVPSSAFITLGLWDEFDARGLSLPEKRFLQAALALEGHYAGLIDGAWGRGSQSALEQYTRQIFDRDKPLNADAAYLAMSAIDTFVADGWEAKEIDYLALSLMMPMKEMRLKEAEGLLETWEHAEKELTVMFTDLIDAEMAALHNDLLTARGYAGEPYTVRQPSRWVTSVDFEDGTGYVRSELISGTWSTVALFGPDVSRAELGLMTSSITVGRPVDMLPETGGVLLGYATELASLLAEDDPSTQDANESDSVGSAALPRQNYGAERPPLSSGTGFFVNGDAYMLTNAHVVEGCSNVTVGGVAAEVVAISQAFDLAAVRPRNQQGVSFLTFASSEIGLNADITIAGYPLHGLLGGLNVSRGSISAMKGLGGDETNMQISAPVQPGNSGGPAVDRGGNVVGVVVSKLNVMEVANFTGDIAQNVNFAIRGSMAKIFMQTNDINFEEGISVESLPPERVAELLQAATRLIECVPD